MKPKPGNQKSNPTYHQNKNSKSKGAIHHQPAGPIINLPDSQTKKLLMLALAIIALIVITDWRALTAQASFIDDKQYLINNSLVQHPGWASAGRFFTEVLSPSTVNGYYQPLAMISLMLDYAMGGRPNNLTLFHLTNIILHILNTLLIFLLIYLLFKKVWSAFTVAILFGIHPMTVEALCWISERKALLAAFFVLLALVLYLLYIDKKKKGFLWAAVLAFVPALLSKPTSLPLPLLLILLDYWPLQRFNKKAVLEKIPFFLLAMISAAITYISQANMSGLALPAAKRSLWQTLLVICHNIFFYISKIFLPINLSPHYPVPNPLAISHPEILAGVIFTVILITLCVISLRKGRALFTGLMFFLIAIFPALGIIEFTTVLTLDNYAYLPFVGFLIILAWLLNLLYPKLAGERRVQYCKTGFLVFVSMVVCLEIFATWSYLAKWQNTGTLCKYMIGLAPREAVIYGLLGEFDVDHGKFDEGIQMCTQSIALDPKSAAAAYFDRGTAYYNEKRYPEALADLKQAILINPAMAEAYCNYGALMFAQQDFDKAIAMFNKAAQLAPSAITYFNLAKAYQQKKNFSEALGNFKKALTMNPDNYKPYVDIAIILEEQGNFGEATPYMEQALSMDSPDINLHGLWAGMLARHGKISDAVEEYRTILRINPNVGWAQQNLDKLLHTDSNPPGRQ